MPTTSQRMLPSSKRNPCPICGRTKDNDCRITQDGSLAICHHGSTHHPPSGLYKGKVIDGLDGRQWAFTGDSKDGRGAVFTIDKPRERMAAPSKPLRPACTRSWVYADGEGTPVIQVNRTDDGSGNREISQTALIRGYKPADLQPYAAPYRYAEAKSALEDGAPYVFWVEGEPCADALWGLGLPAVTSIGGTNNFRPERDAGLFPPDRLVICPDRDRSGLEYAQKVADAYPGCKWLLCWPDQPALWNGSCPPKHGLDVADWIASGVGVEQILAAIIDSPADIQPGRDLPDDGGTSDDEHQQPLYSELVHDTLSAIQQGRIDDEMQLRAEIMARFRCSDGKLQAELFRQLRRSAVGIKTTTAPPRSIDIRKVQGLDWLVDGYVPSNDQVLLWGESGAGKTTAVVQMGFAVINGTGFLDRATASRPGRVLFIASDSGAAPFQNTLLDAGLLDHPAFDPGPDQSAFVWACDPDQGMDAWSCCITDIMRLESFVKEEEIDLVVIDSAKAVTSAADIDYTNNGTITAMLTFFKDVICQHTSVVWVSHDGTAKGAHAGAKAWREVPSMVHQIEKVNTDGGDAEPGGHTSTRMRLWNVRKDRMGNERDIRYQIGDGGRLEPCAGVEVIKDCRKAVMAVLEGAYGNGIESLSSKGIIEEVQRAHGYSSATVRTNLSRLHRGRNPEVRRCSRPIGHWELAPRIKESLSRARRGCPMEINQTPETLSSARAEVGLTQVDGQLLRTPQFDPIKLSQTAQTPLVATDSESLIDLAQSPPARAREAAAPDDSKPPLFVPGDPVAVLIEDEEVRGVVTDAPGNAGGLYRVRLGDGRELLKSESFLVPWAA
jgi:hypothetical protein